MGEKSAKKVPKEEVKTGTNSSVKTYQHGIDSEKQKMAGYSKKFGTNVNSLKNKFNNFNRKDIKEAVEKMNEKVNKFKGHIRGQIRENKEAVNKIENGVKFLISEVNNKKKDFRAYARGPFTTYINEFWGLSKE